MKIGDFVCYKVTCQVTTTTGKVLEIKEDTCILQISEEGETKEVDISSVLSEKEVYIKAIESLQKTLDRFEN